MVMGSAPGRTPPPTLTVLLRGADVSLGVLGPLVIVVTDGPRAWAQNQVKNVVGEVERLRKSTHRERLIYVYVAAASSDIPDQAARKASAPLGALFDECIGVHEGDGFRASLTRAVVTSISMLAPIRVRPEIVVTVEEAAQRLGPRVSLPSRVIYEAIEAVRSAAHSEV